MGIDFSRNHECILGYEVRIELIPFISFRCFFLVFYVVVLFPSLYFAGVFFNILDFIKIK